MGTPINPVCLCRHHKSWLSYYGTLQVGEELLTTAHGPVNVQSVEDSEECVACQEEG